MNYDMPVRVLTQKDLMDAGCFDLQAAIDVVEDGFRDYATGNTVFPDKVSVVFNQETQDRINCLPAAIKSEEIYGMKWVSVFPDNPYKRGKENLTAVYLLSELRTGYPVAFMEGSLCSNMRTAAVGAVAAKYLARKNCETIGFIGAGEQAKMHFLAMKAIRPSIRKCYVSSRTHATEQKFIEQMKKFAPDVEFIACESNYRMAAESADIIVTAISGQEKILQADWVKEGAFYCHVAGLEDDFAVPKKASKIVCDSWNVVKHRTQTISQMYTLGLLDDVDIYGDLHEIVMGQKPGRENEQEFIYFNSVGMSYIDTKLSTWMFRKAEAAGTGTVMNMKEKSIFD